jgi:hypothetical protein
MKIMMIRMLLVGVVALAIVGPAKAGPILIFSGQDSGASTGGPFPFSTAAQTSFETSATAFGPLNTITYEGLPLGYYSPIPAGPGASITLTGTNFGAGFSGISNFTYGNLYGFNTTSGGSQWLGFPGGSATFTFTTPTHSFGTFLTGLQTAFTGPGDLTFTFNDGTSHTLTPPINAHGGAQYFGFTDASAFSSVTIQNLTADAWGIDDTTYNHAALTPEPGTAVLWLTGIGLGFLMRKRIAQTLRLDTGASRSLPPY